MTPGGNEGFLYVAFGADVSYRFLVHFCIAFEKLLSDGLELIFGFIFITGDALGQTARQFFAAERKPHLNKPFEIGELIGAIENLMFKPIRAEQANKESGGDCSV